MALSQRAGGQEALAQERWEHFPHVADIGVRGFGATKAGAFAQAATALAVVITDPGLVRPDELVTVACHAPDVEAAEHAHLARMVARLEPLICVKG